jgi:hypothetical protein
MIRRSNPKEEGYLLPLKLLEEALPFAIHVKGGDKLGS